MHKEFLKSLLKEHPKTTSLFKRNLIKEYLQVVVLSFVYSHPEYKNMIFYGGSCLRHCFGLQRLSEDLDFVDLKKEINLLVLEKDLVNFFTKEKVIVNSKLQKFRIYLKFPILKELGIGKAGESDLIYLKVEVYKEFDFCPNFETQIKPVFKFNKSILIKTFDLPTLMATKLIAILHRKWEKTSKKGEILIRVKGRDYFDLMWYLDNKIKPNFSCLKGIKNDQELEERLLVMIRAIDSQSIKLDLESLIEDGNFVEDLSKNLREILINQIHYSL